MVIKTFRLETENSPIRLMKIFQLKKGKCFQSELVNWEMIEKQGEDLNERISKTARASLQSKIIN
jgi:hypothetical protein